MKKTLLVVCMFGGLSLSYTAKAASGLATLIQRIALLQVYLGYVKQGYTIVRNGINLVNDIKNGEFNMHDNYFKSLKRVNPIVRQYPKLSSLLALQEKTGSQLSSTSRFTNKSSWLQDSEKQYIQKVLALITTESKKDMDHLDRILTNGELNMKDAERMKEIDQLFIAVQERYQGLCGFSRDLRLLTAGRQKEQKDITEMRQIYRLP